MSKFNPGDIVYHKATNKKCVIIRTENEEQYLVRTEENLKDTYYEVELETSSERKARFPSYKATKTIY